MKQIDNMEGAFSDNFKRKFLISFTKEIIKHSGKMDIVKLENIIKSKEKTNNFLKKETIELPYQNVQYKKILKESESFEFSKQKIPLHLEYLKSITPKKEEIDLYKISSLIQNPEVKMVIGNSDEKVSIIDATGTKMTDIFLSKEDIDRIINSFSEKSNTPINEGVYKVNFRNLTLSAVISEVIGSRFVIKKNSLPY